jgi:hypothetical protein
MLQELGVADALSNKYLKTLQLGIYNGEICPETRVEAYIMAFTYDEDGVNMQLEFTGGRLPAPASKTLVDAKKELRFLVHRLTNQIGGFPELPGTIPDRPMLCCIFAHKM